MLDDQLMDVLSTPGKAGGGYCTGLGDYEMPFIFANFNGTQHDVEVVTHEAGHAFAAYMNRDRIPYSYVWPSMEACEVHSMSMEFFAWPWADGFFGADARKFRYSHLAGALTFIPYGTMVDHFQHIVYEHPELTPAQRHEEWKKLAAIYQPWMRLDGEIPFYARVSTGSARCTFIRARSTTSTTVWPRPSACSSGRCCKRTAPMRGATTWPTRSRAAAAPSPNC